MSQEIEEEITPLEFNLQCIYLSQGAQNAVAYIGRYLKHPPLSEYNIKDDSPQEETVTFCYKRNHDGKGQKEKGTFTINEFLTRLAANVPPKGLHLCVSIGMYAPRTGQKVRALARKLQENVVVVIMRHNTFCCPYCEGTNWEYTRYAPDGYIIFSTARSPPIKE